MPDCPNILFLMCDHGRSQAFRPGGPCLAPNLDALSAQGVRLHRAYTVNAICSPTRASLMTGLYPSTHGVWDCTHTQRPEWVDVRRGPFWSQRLTEAGYHTGYFGKWHIEQSGDLSRFGWAESANRSSAPVRPDASQGILVRTPGYKDQIVAAAATVDDVHHPAFEDGIDFLRRHAGKGRPWCCFVSASEPHDPYYPPRRFLEMYDIASVPLPETLRYVQDPEPQIISRMRGVWRGLTDEHWRFIAAAYYATNTWLDREVGRILDVLREAGDYDETLIVFTSDHGDMLGGHGLFAKGCTPYEEVYNIPLIFRVPGLAAVGEETRHLASVVDVAPTLLDFCGLEPIVGAQGQSLRPVLEGRAGDNDFQNAYAEYYAQRIAYTQRIVWHGPWKYVFSPGGVDELYNLADDPAEKINLAANPNHRETLLEMARCMWAKMAEIGDDSLFNTHYATLRLAPVGPLEARQ